MLIQLKKKIKIGLHISNNVIKIIPTDMPRNHSPKPSGSRKLDY